MKKLVGLLGLAALGFVAERAYALPTGTVEGHVTTVSLSDKSLETGVADTELQVTFDAAGTDCGTPVAAGGTYSILKSKQSSGVFDHLVKQAQSAYLSGKVLRYSTKPGSGTNSGICYAYYMQLK